MSGLYFGPEEQRLFGLHHPPLSPPARDLGVVLCHPLGHEATGSLRTFRVLADRLARSGFHVLRFDYFATGDSAGASEDGEAERWVGDVGEAVELLRRVAGLLRVMLIGLRMGATLATLAATRRTDVEALVLWEPAVEGGQWLAAARGRHDAWLRAEAAARPAMRGLATPEELLGYPMTPVMAASIERLRLDTLSVRPARRALLVGRPDQPELDGLVRHLRSLGTDVEHAASSAPAIWEADVGFEQALVPIDVVRTIEQWTCGVRV